MRKKDRSKQLKRKIQLVAGTTANVSGRRKQGSASPSLVYRSIRCKSEELAELTCATEAAIVQAFAESGQVLLDRDVRAALECLIVRIRRDDKEFHPADSTCETADARREAIIARIDAGWERQPAPSHDDKIGVLRTLLNSIEIWSAQSNNSRGYLRFLEEFLSQGSAADGP